MKNKEINLSSSALDNDIPVDFKKEENNEENLQEKAKEGNGKFKEKLKNWWNNLTTYKKVILVVIPALLILSGAVFFVYQVIYGPINRPPKLVSINEEFLAPKLQNSGIQFIDLRLKEPSVPRTEESPINGRLFTKEEMEELKERRPVAVMINNNPAARPTSSLSQADLIFETLVEGGATRMSAIFWSRKVNKVGTIRSVRQYFLEWVSPFDPLFVYDGFASSSDPKVNAGGNMSNYNIKSVATNGAWRVSDRSAPHNEYSSVVNAWDFAKTRGWEGFPTIQPWKFKRDASIDNRGDRFLGTMNFSNDRNYSVTWKYDRGSNTYLRNIAGIADLDLETGQQLAAKNIIIQEVQVQGPVDAYNRLIIEMIGSGNAIILQDGKVVNGKWEKEYRTSRTKYYDGNGEEVQFNRGLTWILAAQQIQTKFDIIEQ